MRLPFRAVIGSNGRASGDGEGIWIGEHRLHGVRGFEITHAAGQIPTVTVALAVYDIETSSGAADVVLAAGVAESLIALGWTPPADAEGEG